MSDGIHILAVELDGDDGILVTFSDRTTGGYVVEELLELRPIRERDKVTKIKDANSSGNYDTSGSCNR